MVILVGRLPFGPGQFSYQDRSFPTSGAQVVPGVAIRAGNSVTG